MNDETYRDPDSPGEPLQKRPRLDRVVSEEARRERRVASLYDPGGALNSQTSETQWENAMLEEDNQVIAPAPEDMSQGEYKHGRLTLQEVKSDPPRRLSAKFDVGGLGDVLPGLVKHTSGGLATPSVIPVKPSASGSSTQLIDGATTRHSIHEMTTLAGMASRVQELEKQLANTRILANSTHDLLVDTIHHLWDAQTRIRQLESRLDALMVSRAVDGDDAEHASSLPADEEEAPETYDRNQVKAMDRWITRGDAV